VHFLRPSSHHNISILSALTQLTHFTSSAGKRKQDLDWGTVTYLESASAVVPMRGRTLKIFGALWTPKYGNWAVQYAPAQVRNIWRGRIPRDADIVMTHGPARGHLDGNGTGHAGCA
jgi:hypothetical protein